MRLSPGLPWAWVWPSSSSITQAVELFHPVPIKPPKSPSLQYMSQAEQWRGALSTPQ